MVSDEIKSSSLRQRIIFDSDPTLTIDLQAIYEGNLPINNRCHLAGIQQETF